MKRIYQAILLMLVAAQAPGVDAAPQPLTPDCRYLFIVDTSLSMSRLHEKVSVTLSGMIATGLNGQMESGEIFTIWTFNDSVQQREYPLMSWTPERQSMRNRVLQFMQAQRYRRTANMRALINAIYEAKRTCPRLAVFIVSNGQEVLVGTPFDRSINIGYGRRFEELRSAKVPFLTTLVCKDGNFIAWSVGAMNEPVKTLLGLDGKQIVGPNQQAVEPAPIPAGSSPTPVAAVKLPTSAIVPLVPKQMPPVTSIESPLSLRQQGIRPKVIILPAGPEPVRKVIELKTKKVEILRVVRPTEIVRQPKVKIPHTSFRKTNEIGGGVSIVAVTNRPAEVPTPAPQKFAKLEIQKTNQTAAVEPSSPIQKQALESLLLAAKTPAPEVAKPKLTRDTQVPTVKVVEPPAEVRVVIQMVTQFVNVPISSIASVALASAEHAFVPAIEKDEPVLTVVAKMEPAKMESEPVAVVNSNNTPRGADPKPGSNTTISPAPVPTRAESDTGSALGWVLAPDVMSRVYLGLGILVLLIALACVRKLTNRPIDSSMISQSMERRDNG